MAENNYSGDDTMPCGSRDFDRLTGEVVRVAARQSPTRARLALFATVALFSVAMVVADSAPVGTQSTQGQPPATTDGPAGVLDEETGVFGEDEGEDEDEDETHPFGIIFYAAIDVRPEDTQKTLPWSELHRRTDRGHQKLNARIKANPERYPMATLEDPNKSEPDDFRRWEFQMRRYPVEIVAVSEADPFVEVAVDAPAEVTFCADAQADVNIFVSNPHDYEIPQFELVLAEIPGLVREKVEQTSQIDGLPAVVSTHIESITVPNMKAGSKHSFRLSHVVSCDGKGGAAALKGSSEIEISPAWRVTSFGYLLDLDNRTLFKVAQFGGAAPIKLRANNP